MRNFTTSTSLFQTEDDLKALRSTAFHLSWRQSPEISQWMWKVDLSRYGEEGFGELHLLLPVIYFNFPGVCAEVNDELFFSVLQGPSRRSDKYVVVGDWHNAIHHMDLVCAR